MPTFNESLFNESLFGGEPPSTNSISGASTGQGTASATAACRYGAQGSAVGAAVLSGTAWIPQVVLASGLSAGSSTAIATGTMIVLPPPTVARIRVLRWLRPL